jgi:hypothetical protein
MKNGKRGFNRCSQIGGQLGRRRRPMETIPSPHGVWTSVKLSCLVGELGFVRGTWRAVVA